MKNTRFFTLIEILVTIAIISILSLIGYGSYTYATNAVKTARSEALVKNIAAGLEAFYTKNNYYPASTGGDFNAIKIALGTDNTVSAVNFGAATLDAATAPEFFKAVDLEQMRQNAALSGELTDAWGTIICYRAPGVFNPSGYDLVAAGPDGKFSSDNADTPAGITDIGKFRTVEGEHLCDDLFDF